MDVNSGNQHGSASENSLTWTLFVAVWTVGRDTSQEIINLVKKIIVY